MSVVRVSVGIFFCAVVASSASGAVRGNVRFTSPEWSPDGKRIAFVESRTVQGPNSFIRYGSLWTMSIDGSDFRLVVAERPWLDEPSWSSDGRRLAFCVCGQTNGGIYTVRADGSGLRLVRGGGAHSPAWSPGGRWIAYIDPATDDYGGSVKVTAPDGKTGMTIASYDDRAAWLDPAWSRDGNRLSFVATDPPDTSGVVPYLADVTSLRRPHIQILSHVRAASASWSPTSQLILFSFNNTLRILDLRHQRTRFFHDGGSGDWSPDGRRIVLSGADGRLFTISSNGRDLRLLAPS